jgi:hypothetical protein
VASEFEIDGETDLYEGYVAEFDASTGYYTVIYDDGDDEDLLLADVIKILKNGDVDGKEILPRGGSSASAQDHAELVMDENSANDDDAAAQDRAAISLQQSVRVRQGRERVQQLRKEKKLKAVEKKAHAEQEEKRAQEQREKRRREHTDDDADDGMTALIQKLENKIAEKEVTSEKESEEATPKRPSIVRQGTMGGNQNTRLSFQHNGHLAGDLLPMTEEGGNDDVGSEDDDDSIETGEKKAVVGKNGDDGLSEEATPKRPSIVRQGTLGGNQNTRLSFQHNGHLAGDLLPMAEGGNDDEGNLSSDDEDASERASIFLPGDRVEALHGGEDDWRLGKIQKANADGTFVVLYDGGDSEAVEVDHIVAADGAVEKGRESSEVGSLGNAVGAVELTVANALAATVVEGGMEPSETAISGREGGEEATPKRPSIVYQETMGGDQNTGMSFQNNGHNAGSLLPMTEGGGSDFDSEDDSDFHDGLETFDAGGSDDASDGGSGGLALEAAKDSDSNSLPGSRTPALEEGSSGVETKGLHDGNNNNSPPRKMVVGESASRGGADFTQNEQPTRGSVSHTDDDHLYNFQSVNRKVDDKGDDDDMYSFDSFAADSTSMATNSHPAESGLSLPPFSGAAASIVSKPKLDEKELMGQGQGGSADAMLDRSDQPIEASDKHLDRANQPGDDSSDDESDSDMSDDLDMSDDSDSDVEGGVGSEIPPRVKASNAAKAVPKSAGSSLEKGHDSDSDSDSDDSDDSD